MWARTHTYSSLSRDRYLLLESEILIICETCHHVLKEELQNLHAVSSRIVRDSRPSLPTRLQSRPANIGKLPIQADEIGDEVIGWVSAYDCNHDFRVRRDKPNTLPDQGVFPSIQRLKRQFRAPLGYSIRNASTRRSIIQIGAFHTFSSRKMGLMSQYILKSVPTTNTKAYQTSSHYTGTRHAGWGMDTWTWDCNMERLPWSMFEISGRILQSVKALDGQTRDSELVVLLHVIYYHT